MLYFNTYNPLFHHIPSFFPFSKKESLLKGVHTLTQLREKLGANFTVQQWESSRNEIKKIIQNHSTNLEELNLFINEALEWGINQGHYSIEKELADLIDINTLKKLAIKKNQGISINVHELAKTVLSISPPPKQLTFRDKVFNTLRIVRMISFPIFPNLFNMAYEIAALINSPRKFKTLWDRYLLIELAYKFFLIPQLLIKTLTPVLVVPATVYIVAAAIFFAGSIAVTLYQRWYRIVPNEIVNCKNLDHEFEFGTIKPKVGQAEAIHKVILKLMGSNVLLIAKSGEGKTALVNRLVQLKHEGTLPQELARLNFFSLHGGDLMGHTTFGHSEMLIHTKDSIRGLEDRLIIFFDEIDQLTTNEICFQNFKQRFLSEDEAAPKIIAATTEDGYKAILKADKDGSFLQRIVPFELEAASDSQCRMIINELLERSARDLPCTVKAIERVLQLSTKREGAYDYLPNVGRLAKIKKIMSAVIGRCRLAYSSNYCSKELASAKDKYKNLQSNLGLFHRKSSTQLSELNNACSQVNAFQTELDDLKKKTKKIHDTVIHRFNAESEFYQISSQLSQRPSQVELEKRFLLHRFYVEESYDKVIQGQIDQIKSKMDVEINEDLVKAVYQELEIEQKNLDKLGR